MATYEGASAGQYAIYSTVPKVHESGDFTADVTLEANFDADKVSCTINGFVVDGNKKDWTIALQENADGLIDNRVLFGKAIWEIDGTQPNNADKASSEWAGGFRDIGADGVPGIGGGFYDALNGSASMFGSFGVVKKQK